jgi:hypothetical protein
VTLQVPSAFSVAVSGAMASGKLLPIVGSWPRTVVDPVMETVAMAPSLNQRGELIYPNLSLKWLNPGRAERRQSLERATQAMVNEIGYPRKIPRGDSDVCFNTTNRS